MEVLNFDISSKLEKSLCEHPIKLGTVERWEYESYIVIRNHFVAPTSTEHIIYSVSAGDVDIFHIIKTENNITSEIPSNPHTVRGKELYEEVK